MQNFALVENSLLYMRYKTSYCQKRNK